MKRNPVILFNLDTNMETCEGPMEIDVAQKYMPLVTSRVLVPPGSLVIARFGLLPFYQEMERDLSHLGATLVNTYAQHRWIANMTDWASDYGVLAGMTPRTWTSHWNQLPVGSYVVKGRTNSKKQSWNTRMFAPTREDVPRIAARLLEDENISDQGVVAREYIPLKKLDEGLNGLPITNEWRVFFLCVDSAPILLAKGFYWKHSHPEAEAAALWSDKAEQVARKAAQLVAPHVPFFVIDVAETATDDWIIVEVNDAQMSGLCGVPADDLYANLAKALL